MCIFVCVYVYVYACVHTYIYICFRCFSTAHPLAASILDFSRTHSPVQSWRAPRGKLLLSSWTRPRRIVTYCLPIRLPQGLLEDSMSLFAEVGMFPYLAVLCRRACLPRWCRSLSAVLHFPLLCVTCASLSCILNYALCTTSLLHFSSLIYPLSLSLSPSPSLSLSLLSLPALCRQVKTC